LIHDGMVRGPAWRLLDMGRRIAWSKNLGRLLQTVLWQESVIDPPVLKALLEVIDCRMTYRSRYFDNLQQNAVLDLCLTDETCPRSIAAQLIALADHVDALPSDGRSPLKTEEQRAVMAALHAVRMSSSEHIEPGSSEQLPELFTELDSQLCQLSQIVTKKYLLHSGIPRQIASDMELPQ
jgi:uncharacterized alpha-E superfamily protein